MSLRNEYSAMNVPERGGIKKQVNGHVFMFYLSTIPQGFRKYLVSVFSYGMAVALFVTLVLPE
jgi:hypothetical protein